MSLIAICIATYRRPEMLQTLLDSLRKTALPSSSSVELRIVDNDKDRSAEPIVSQFIRNDNQFSNVVYIAEPAQNIALARNAGIEQGEAEYFIFVDDDEWVPENWLISHWETAGSYQADAVFGPVHGICADGTAKWIEKGQFFDKLVPETGTKIDWKNTRTSNTLVRGEWFYGQKQFRFDAELGRSGGSDSDLFSRIAADGGIFVSCREAMVFEHAPSSRTNLRWLWGRYYRNGLIYERITSRRDDEISSAHRFFRRIGAALLLCTTGLFGVLRGDSTRFFRGLLKIPLAMGGLRAALRPDSTAKHVAYKGTKKRKVAFLTNIVSPYRKPVFDRLHETPDWDFRVFADAKSEFDRKWKVDEGDLPIEYPRCISWKRTVKSSEPVPFEQTITLHVPIGLFFRLVSSRPDVVISLELGLRSAVAALYCTVFRKRLILWAYQSRISGTQGRSRLLWRKLLLRRAKKVVGMGIQAREVLNGWGVPNHKIVDALNAADHVTFQQRLSSDEADAKVQQIRHDFAPGKRIALVVGRLIPLKGVEYLLDIWQKLPAPLSADWQLIFVGDGPLSPLIENVNSAAVSWVGSIPSPEMPFWYQAADLHIFPTCGDVWGLVVNEASEVATPTLCSIHAGCCDNLIHDEVDGLSFDPTRPDEALESLQKALRHPRLKEIGLAAQKTVSAYTLDNLAQSFRNATLTD